MEQALSNRSFSALNAGRHEGRLFEFRNRAARFYLTKHRELAASDLAHYHDEPHITFILRGAVVDRRRARETELVAGGLMYFRAGETHRTIGQRFPTEYISLQFEPAFFARHPEIEEQLAVATANGPAAKFTMLRLYRELLANDEFSADSAELLLRSLTEDAPPPKNRPPGWIKNIVEMLHDRWNAPVTLDELAAAAGVHPKTVSRYFPQFFGCTLGEYRRRLKVERALPLIAGSALSLTEIAHECDFCDQSHFIRTFKRTTGFLPNHFKKL